MGFPYILEQIDICPLDLQDKDLSGKVVLLNMLDLTLNEFRIIDDN